MKFLLVFIFMFLLATAHIFAQTPVQTPLPQPTPDQREVLRQQILEQERQQQEFERMRALSDQSALPGLSPSGGAGYGDPTEMYRKTTKKELKILAPDEKDLIKYRSFLAQPNAGLIKLAADKKCFENSNVVVATPECLAYTMPGAGISYSFRVRDYRIPRLADITFTDNSFQATGIRLHGFFAELGDIPLEQVNLQTNGVNFAADFKAESDFEKAKQIDLSLIKGIDNNGFRYRRAIEAKDNTTYVLRSIAYRGKYLRAVQRITYNELDFDKRKDVLIVFRIVRRDDDGAVTILWKQLAVQDSPKTKLNKKTSEKPVLKTDHAAKN